MVTQHPLDDNGDRRRHHGPAGFRAAGSRAASKRSRQARPRALAADRPVPAAGLFTTNQAKAAPVLVSQEHLAWN